jgi:hypothetical protein
MRRSKSHEVGSERGVMLDNAVRHQPDYPPEMPVAPLLYSAGPLKFARVIYHGIYPGKSYELLVRGIVVDAPYLGKKGGRCILADTIDGRMISKSSSVDDWRYSVNTFVSSS